MKSSAPQKQQTPDLKSPPKPLNEIKKDSTPNSKGSGDSKSQNDDRRSDNRQSDNRQDSRHGDRGNQHGGMNKGGDDRRRGGYQGRFQGGQNRGGNLNRGGRRDDQSHSNQHQSQQSLNEMSSGPKEQKKFTGRCRLFVGNITPDTTEEQFKNMFTPFGEVSEVFVNAARGFGFIRLDYRINAEKAKASLDGEMRNNRVLRVRFATHGAALKVTNMSLYISNELLESSFSQFGEVERAVVVVDDRGRPTGEGLVEFARKPGATSALKRINEGVFLLSSYPRPVKVELLEQKDEEDGQTEKFIQKNDAFRKDREKEPRFAVPGSFEFDFALKWRRIDELEKERIEMVKKEMDSERQNLEGEMETAMFDYQAEQIRQDLMRQQEELKRLEEMKSEQMRRRQEMDLRRQEDRMRLDGEERRRQEMMMRARSDVRPSEMQAMQQGREEMMRGGVGIRESPSARNRSSGPGTPPMPPPPIPPGMNLEQGSRGGQGGGGGFGGGQNMGGGGNGNNMGPGGSPNINQNMGGGGGGGGGGGQMQRSPFEGGQGNFRGGPGGQGGNFNPGMGGNMGGVPGQGNLYPGNMRNNQSMNDADRRRDRSAGGHRDDYGDMKRMRRY